MNHTINPRNKLKAWRFWLPLTVQAALIILIPLQSAIIYTTGTAVTLKTIPVDPYDLLRGYSQTLRYEISRAETLAQVSGGQDIFQDDYNPEKQNVYVTLQSPGISENQAWEPIQVSRDRPQSLPKNQVVLKGQYQGRRILYGLETYYMPEQQRDQINDHIRQVQRDQNQSFLVDIKVNGNGKGVPVSLWVGDRKYQF